MKKWMIVALALVAVMRSGRGQDVARLQPVEVVRIAMEGQSFAVEVDSGERGVGESLAHAVADLREGASAEVFLDTAEYVLLGSSVESEELLAFLRPSCMVCYEVGEADLSQVGSFLKTHRPETTLLDYRNGKTPGRLEIKDGRMELAT